MSKICIGILAKKCIVGELLYEFLRSQLEQIGLGIFFDTLDEPLIDSFPPEDYLIFSIADNNEFDNCEMLLLPENCSLNGKKNLVPFVNRMELIKDIMNDTLKFVPQIDLFIGNSGANIDEFEEHQIVISQFLQIALRLNDPFSPDIHFIIRGQRDGFA